MKKNKDKRQAADTIRTPAPPQDINPSIIPRGLERKDDKSKKAAGEKNKPEKLAPSEEL